MDRHIVVRDLTTIFRSVFSNPSLILADDTTASDIERWDSLTHMVMILEVEKQFGIKFRLKDLNKMKTVGDLISIIISLCE
jgi:acyl carrier protein